MAARSRGLTEGGALALVLVANLVGAGCASDDGSDGSGGAGAGDGGSVSTGGTSTGGTGSGGAMTGSGAAANGGANGDGGGSASGGADGGVIAEAPSSGCDGAASPPSGAQAMVVGEDERTYLVSLPEDYDPTHPYPLVFAFHGLGGSGEGVSSQWYFGIEQQGGTPSIFVYPDGLDDGGGTGWPNEGGRDVAFFDAMLTAMTEGYCVDENRVFSAGHSYGGIMTLTLACERAEVLRGVAPVAGARWANSACSGPVAALGIHGNPDEQVSYESGVAAMARILETNGCDDSVTTPVEPTDTCIAYACDAGFPVTWCEHDQGHDFPDFAAASIKAFIDSF